MFSAGMLFCFASAMIVRSRGFMSGSPPPARAATVNSLIRRVKILPRLASAAPFLCLMECHLEWPDMSKLQKNQQIQGGKCYHKGGPLPSPRENYPHIGLLVPGAAVVVAQHGIDPEAGALQAARHLTDGQ